MSSARLRSAPQGEPCPVTAQDWRVTAQREASRSLEHVERATSATDAEPADILRECWAAYRAAGAAVGSWAQGMSADGRPWSEIGAALDLPEHEVTDVLRPLVAQGWARLAERLSAATADAAPPIASTRVTPPWVALAPVTPLRELEGELAERVAGLGARQVNLYRSLAHTPELLEAWIALDAGVTRQQVDALAAWQVSDLFDEREKAALTLTDAMLTGGVPDAVRDAFSRWFDDQERVKLVLTASFYAMVPRVLDALRVPVETPSGC